MAVTETNTKEDDAKALIVAFLASYKRIVVKTTENTEPTTNNTYLTLINGGIINGIKVTGFLELKASILKLMNLSIDNNNNSVALNYIKNNINNK